MRKSLLLVSAAALVAAGAAMPATAAPKPPITKTYTATAAAPDPSNYAPSATYSVCGMTVPGSYYTETFKAPAAGKLKVEMTDFVGDWDLLLVDGKGAELGNSGGQQPADPAVESATVKIKKAGSYNIISCNWAGGPTAKVTYTFTYA
jgi:hypothetical protein